jgi:hypothetical protein
VRSISDEAGLAAVADQALRLNARLRFARLSLVDDAVVAETCLRAELLTTVWIETAVRAVATVCHYTRGPLLVLAEQAPLAKHYGEMFLDA